MNDLDASIAVSRTLFKQPGKNNILNGTPQGTGMLASLPLP
jgi:hypothetical protein